jgi:cyclohexanecarboxylate-CoA ligase
VVDDRRRAGGQDVANAVSALAGRLRATGVRRGDAVAFQLPNGIAAVCLLRACWRLGAVAVPLNRASGRTEVLDALSATAPRLVMGGTGLPVAGLTGALEVPDGTDLFAELAEGPAVEAGESPARPADLAVVIFTSGSTGRPKAVLHTQRGLAWKAVSMGRAHGMTAADVVLTPAPLAHVSGLLNGVLLPAATGATSVLMGRWDPGRAVDLLEAERVTVLTGPPTFVVGLTGAPNFAPSAAATLRLVSVGGAPVSPAFAEGAAEQLGCRVKRTYGSSEAPMVTTSFPDDPDARATGTDGRPVGGAELRVVDPVSGRPAPVGTVGELLVRGPELFVGYADPDDNAGRFAPGGWFRTGDLASLDGDGWLRVVGRTDDVIIRGGENVSAGEVEAVLEAHPDVVHAAAVGYPDELMGERVAAVVVGPETFDLAACGRWFSARGLARFKVPERLVHLRALPALPSGKVDRAALRLLVEDGAEVERAPSGSDAQAEKGEAASGSMP